LVGKSEGNRALVRPRHVWERRGTYRVLVGKSEGNRALVRPRHIWEDNIEMDHMELEGMDWIDMAQDEDKWWAVVNMAMNFRFP
jgi:hypothetical protein